jgi:serine protease Do
LFSAPAFAQKEKEKNEAKERQTIVINRSGESEEETVIKIKGDKVTVNGKDAKDSKDVSVNVHKYKDWSALSPTIAHNDFNVYGPDTRTSLFTEDSNRAMLGVVTDDNEKGAAITSVTKESAAEKAGLKKGDIITKIGDKKISDQDDVSAVIKSHKPGDKVTITIIRDGKEEKITAELAKWKGVQMNTNSLTFPRTPMAPSTGGTIFYNGGRPKMGLSIQDTEDGKGVKVLDLEADAPAAKSGLKKDDVITHVDETAINSTDEIKRLIAKNSQQYTFNFKILRNGKQQNVEVKLPRNLKTANL